MTWLCFHWLVLFHFTKIAFFPSSPFFLFQLLPPSVFFFLKKKHIWVWEREWRVCWVPACNTSTQALSGEAGGSWVWSEPGLHSLLLLKEWGDRACLSIAGHEGWQNASPSPQLRHQAVRLKPPVPQTSLASWPAFACLYNSCSNHEDMTVAVTWCQSQPNKALFLFGCFNGRWYRSLCV